MRLSAPISHEVSTPDAWIAAVREAGFRAAFFPLNEEAPSSQVDEFLAAAREADIRVTEIGGWGNNPLHPDPVLAKQAIANIQAKLRWAERLGACCCVNIAGSRSADRWAAPHPDNFSEETFERIVLTTQAILDGVRPQRTFFCLETMPWVFPSGPDEYLAIIRAVDRPGLAVHLDPVNMINTPARAFRNADFLRECFAKLGPYVKSCHAKDIILHDKLTVHLDECRPGTGVLDYRVFLTELNRLNPDIPIVLEHLPREEYPLAADYVRSIAAELGIQV